jgi:hypothetical protein
VRCPRERGEILQGPAGGEAKEVGRVPAETHPIANARDCTTHDDEGDGVGLEALPASSAHRPLAEAESRLLDALWSSSPKAAAIRAERDRERVLPTHRPARVSVEQDVPGGADGGLARTGGIASGREGRGDAREDHHGARTNRR